MDMKLLMLLPDLCLRGEPGVGKGRLCVYVVHTSQLAWLETGGSGGHRGSRPFWEQLMEVKEAVLEEGPLVLCDGAKGWVNRCCTLAKLTQHMAPVEGKGRVPDVLSVSPASWRLTISYPGRSWATSPPFDEICNRLSAELMASTMESQG